jgi:hypothetical protein
MGISSDSVKATAIWHVYLVPETTDILYLAQRTLERLYRIALNETSAGVTLVRGIELFRKSNAQVPSWSHIPRLFSMLTEEEVAAYNTFPTMELTEEEIAMLRDYPVKWGYRIEAPAARMHNYLAWLENQTTQAGVSLKKRRLKDLDDLSKDYSAIVNCSGFGARELVRDCDFVPYKGQYFVLKSSDSAPVDYIGDDDHPGGMAYVIPRLGEVMMGGCAEEGIEDLELTLNWADTIKRAGLFVPWLLKCSPSDQSRPPVVGIRPCRTTGVRLEIDYNNAAVPVVHNYGHGGSGFSLSWGCAERVADLLSSI